MIDPVRRRQILLSAGLVLTFTAYALIAWFATETALATHRPCTSNFEGGCGYGKVWAAVLSWLAAGAAVTPAAGIGAFAAALPRFKKPLIATAFILAAPPTAYMLYGLYQVVPRLLELLD